MNGINLNPARVGFGAIIGTKTKLNGKTVPLDLDGKKDELTVSKYGNEDSGKKLLQFKKEVNGSFYYNAETVKDVSVDKVNEQSRLTVSNLKKPFSIDTLADKASLEVRYAEVTIRKKEKNARVFSPTASTINIQD